MWAYQFAMMQAYAEKNGLTKFIAMQVRTESKPRTRLSELLTREKNRYNLLYREEEREMIKYCNATGVAVVPVRRLAILTIYNFFWLTVLPFSSVGPTCRRATCSSLEHSRNHYQVRWWQ